MTILLILVSCIVVLYFIGSNAPEGYEDETGFHYHKTSRK